MTFFPFILPRPSRLSPSPERSSDADRAARVLPLDSSVFTIKHVDLLIQQNALQHRTEDFYTNGFRDESLILRRGAAFALEVVCSRPFADKSDLVNFVFTIAGKNEFLPRQVSLFRCLNGLLRLN